MPQTAFDVKLAPRQIGAVSGIQLATGTYVGNGTSQLIAVGFEPDVVILFRDGRAAVVKGPEATWGTGSVEWDGGWIISSGITGTSSTGFTVGSDTNVNANTLTYYYLALKGDGDNIKTGSYLVPGGGYPEDTEIPVGLIPVMVWGFNSWGARSGVVKTTSMDGLDAAEMGAATPFVTNEIKTLTETGFTLGPTGTTTMNDQALTSYWIAFAEDVRLLIDSYIGDGTDDRLIYDDKLAYAAVMINFAYHKVHRIDSLPGDLTHEIQNEGPIAANLIQSLSPFQVGSDAQVNSNLPEHHWFGFYADNAVGDELLGPQDHLLLKLRRRRDNDALALRWVDAPEQPGARGAGGTMRFDQFHRGLGPELAIEADRYQKSHGWMASRPGRVELLGDVSIATTIGGGTDTGPTETTRLLSHSFQWQTKSWFILPGKMIQWVRGAGTPTVAQSAGANQKFRGPAAFFQGRWFCGVEDDDGLSIGHVVLDTDTSTWALNTAAGKTKGSLFFSAHIGLWCLEITNVDPLKGEITWRVKFCHAAADATVDANFQVLTPGTIYNVMPNSVFSLARWLLVFSADGQVLAVSETPPHRTFVAPGRLATFDSEFGLPLRPFGKWLMFGSKEGFYAIDVTGIEVKDFTPMAIQEGLGKDVIRVSALMPYGTDYLVGTRSETTSPYEARLLMLRRYGDRIAYNELLRQDFMGASGAYVIRAMELFTTTGHLHILLGNATEGRLLAVGLPPPIGGRPPHTPAEGWPRMLSASSELRSGYSYGPRGTRMLFTRARSWVEDFPGVGQGTMTIELSTDDGDFVEIVNVEKSGPFDIPLTTAPVGYAAALNLLATVTHDDGTRWPVWLLPIYLDYIEEPKGGFRVEFDAIASGGLRRAGMRQEQREDLIATLEGLKGLPITTTLLESGTVYTDAVVEQVEAMDIRPPGPRERPQASVRVTLKLLGT